MALTPGDQIAATRANRNKMFTQQRDEAVSAVRAGGQAAGDALNRRFAAIGQSGSGAQMAAGLKLNNQVADQTNKAIGGVNANEQAAAEADLNRDIQQKNIEDSRNLQSSQFDRQFGLDESLKRRAADLADKQFQMDKETTAFNMHMSKEEADRKPGLLGGGGILGTGIKLGKEGK